MKNFHFHIFLATLMLVIYVMISQFYPNPILLTAIYVFAPLLMVWTVYEVLREGIPVRKAADKYLF